MVQHDARELWTRKLLPWSRPRSTTLTKGGDYGSGIRRRGSAYSGSVRGGRWIWTGCVDGVVDNDCSPPDQTSRFFLPGSRQNSISLRPIDAW